MDPPNDAADTVAHMREAAASLARCTGSDAVGLPPAALADAARHLAAARACLSPAVGTSVAARPVRAAAGESEDERIERTAADAQRRAEAVTRGLDLTEGERRFARYLGERLVDVATDTYRDWSRSSGSTCGRCIPAGVAVALAIVHDPADPDGGV